MPDQAPNIDVKPGDKGRLVYDKKRRTIVAERQAHHVMTREEYDAMLIKGWHEVCRDIDNAGNVGVRFLSR